ncbi:hypothetical protein AJ78_07495 [Emergomyces pasteurianus Ep9510]|uniref:Uncharacterized protein n=1 Tax=Emergomyces pasteurianus Ep9510 TaxID=1447872 RepID=A0A1J9P6S2_9EURO|nr:hypothetical protein AJ78_07495 [Emergomyces pasteurianus Ep9510]
MIFKDFAQFSAIRNSMNSMNNFLNTAGEVVEDFPSDLEQHVIQHLEPEEPEDEEKAVDMEVHWQITTPEALDLVPRLRLYEEQQEKGRYRVNSTIELLNCYERRFGARKASSRRI